MLAQLREIGISKSVAQTPLEYAKLVRDTQSDSTSTERRKSRYYFGKSWELGVGSWERRGITSAMVTLLMPSSTSGIVTELSQAYTAWRYGAEAQQIDRLQELLISLRKEKIH
jgi:hypothetical protein